MEDLLEFQNTLNDDTEKHIDEISKQLEAEYLLVAALILKELRKIFNKYSENGKLTYSEMKKYKRLVSLISKINGHLDGFYNKVYKIIDQAIINEYEGNYGAYRGYIEEYMSIDSEISTPSKNNIREIFTAMLVGLTVKEILQKNKNDIMYTLQNQIRNGISEKSNYSQMSKRIQNSFDKSFKKLVYIKDWQLRKTAQKSTLDINTKIQEEGIAKVTKIWRTQRDAKVRKSHTRMEGQEVGINEEFTFYSGKKTQAPRMSGIIEEDANCRCFLSYSYKK